MWVERPDQDKEGLWTMRQQEMQVTRRGGRKMVVPTPAEDPFRAGQRRLPECLRTACLRSFRRAEVVDAWGRTENWIRHHWMPA